MMKVMNFRANSNLNKDLNSFGGSVFIEAGHKILFYDSYMEDSYSFSKGGGMYI